MDAVTYKNITATGQIKAGAGYLTGIIVNSNSSGTIVLQDGLTATGNKILDTYAFGTGSSSIVFSHPINFYVGLFATLGGTANITLLYN